TISWTWPKSPRSVGNPISTSNVYVTPARAGVETTCDIVAFCSRTTIGSGVVALIIGSVLNLELGRLPIWYWPATADLAELNVSDAVQPTILSSANWQPGPQILKIKYVFAV